MKLLTRIFALLLAPAFLQAQETDYPKNYFHAPLDIPLVLSGNFGELRDNHFHTGIDITTQGKEGLNVKASADGYVSRIKVGAFGYGKAVYITHPNGFTTVYGHLSKFGTAIAEYVKTNQYLAESFEVDLFPKAGELTVKQDEVFAYSGNTGSSGGPHLHFEIRDAKTEEALNPLLFGMPVRDDIDPTAVTLLVCPAEPGAVVNGSNGVKKIPLKRSGHSYVFVNPGDSLVTFGKIGYAVEAYDKESIPNGKNGVYAIRLQADQKTIYAHHLARMPFDKSRYINCFTDYKEHEANNRWYMRSFLLPNNELPIYDTLVNRGYTEFKDNAVHRLKYFISDAYGNTVTISFSVRSLAQQPKYKDVVTLNKPFLQVLVWDQPNEIDETLFRFETPEKAVYANMPFVWEATGAKIGAYASRITFDRFTPLHKACTLTVYAAVPEALQKRALLVLVNKNGGYSPAGGTWTGKGVTAEIKELGTYTVAVDTVPPVVRPSNFDLKGATAVSLSGLTRISFTMGDNLSGIASYRATIDGKWVLLEYEPKRKTIWHTFDERTGKGSHKLVLTVTDKVGNSTVYEKTFMR
jgi:murein DD-endopeptidase MepM/ murein hydrolase activator NlpD